MPAYLSEDDMGISELRQAAQTGEVSAIKVALDRVLIRIREDAQAHNALRAAGLVKGVWHSLPSKPELNKLMLKYHKQLLDVHNAAAKRGTSGKCSRT